MEPLTTEDTKLTGVNIKSSPQTIPAGVIGTDPVASPKPTPSRNIMDQLEGIRTQALAIQDRLNTQAETEQQAPPSPRDAVFGNYMNMFQEGLVLSDEAQSLQQNAADANLRLRNLSTQLTQYDKETKDEEYRMRLNQEGKLIGALEASINNYRYERYARPGGAADMAIEAQFALNNAQYAYELANNAVQAESDRYKSQLQGFKDLYTMLGDDMTESEKMRYDSQLRMYELQQRDFMDSKSVAMQRAAQKNAPEEVILAIRNAQSTDEVWQSAGVYGEDPDLAIRRRQTAVSEGNLALAYDKFEWDKWHSDRTFAIEQGVRAGEISKEDAEKAKTAVAMLRNNNKILNAIDEALNNKLGLRGATGQYKAGWQSYILGGPLFGSASINAKENFENDIKLIASAQTLEEFSNLGFSLAPVTEKELDLVGSSANDVLSSVTISEDGEISITGSTEEFENNLKALRDQTEAAVNALMEDPALQTGVLGNDFNEIKNEYLRMTGQSPEQYSPTMNSFYSISSSMTNAPTQ